MTLELQASMPWWAPLGDPVQVGFRLVNRTNAGFYVNRRCAVGHPGSGADISLEVYDAHRRRVPSKRVDIPPPTAKDFAWLDPGRATYGLVVHDLLSDYELPIGKFEVEMTYRVLDQVPPELHGQPVFQDTILAFMRPLQIIHWGVAPPPRPRELLR